MLKNLSNPFQQWLNEKYTIVEAFNRFFALIVKNITSQLNYTSLTQNTQPLYTDKMFKLNHVNTEFVLSIVMISALVI